MAEYQYKRELKNVTDLWHKINLPQELYQHVQKGLSDIRIYGLTENNDTVEVPYLFEPTFGGLRESEVYFELLNSSQNSRGYFFTFDVGLQKINHIDLNFEQENYDWLVDVEGSMDLNEWFLISENIRILSIINESTSYTFDELNFSTSLYRYIRIIVKTKEKPKIETARIKKYEVYPGEFDEAIISNFTVHNNLETKQTLIDVVLVNRMPICNIKIEVSDTLDYLRPMYIDDVVDSIKTELGWHYRYNTFFHGDVKSTDTNSFYFTNHLIKKFRITIENHDNKPLTIKSISAQGHPYYLTARFADKAKYYLVYGNKNASQAQYDIASFQETIPKDLKLIELGAEEKIAINESETTPLFTNKIWLIAIMILIASILLFLSLKMIRKK